VVGVNRFQAAEGEPIDLAQPDFSALEAGQRAQLAALKQGRDAATVEARLAEIRAAARGSDNLMPPIIAAVKEMVTLGEISDALRAEWGVYRAA
jgi:methylmalonyl-CoA mutase, N-terminal domain